MKVVIKAVRKNADEVKTQLKELLSPEEVEAEVRSVVKTKKGVIVELKGRRE